MKTNKKNIKKEKKDRIRNIVFIIVVIIFLCLIFFLSLNTKRDNNSDEIFSFSSSEFENITTIGLYEYQASLDYDGISIIFFCNNESKKCYDELYALDEIAKEKELSIEYIDILELVDSEKNELINSSEIFKNNEYPNLILVKDKKIKNISDKYLTKEETEDLFKEYEIIE